MSEPTEGYGARVASVADLAPGSAMQVEVDGHAVALVRDSDGAFHAVDDECTHGNVSLAEGEVSGCTLECWLHGSRFDLLTGRPAGPPATEPVTVHAVTEVDGDLFVRLNPPA